MHFPVFAKNFRRPWMKLKFFFANFQILPPLGCQGWVVIPQNVKKSKSLHPTVHTYICSGSVQTYCTFVNAEETGLEEEHTFFLTSHWVDSPLPRTLSSFNII
jgi:hypothetical protein